MNWYMQHRMEWIAETVRVFGFINREHLVRKFGISVPHASADIAMFRRMHPGVIDYKPRQKRYLAVPKPPQEKK